MGAGTGAASLPLRPRELIAVDESAAMLDELTRRAEGLGVPVRVIEGRWPDVAGRTPVADVAVCAHVVFNVPDLPEFFAALTAHARRRVVVELPERHPTSWLNPLWEHFHGLRRPATPTYADAVAIARALGYGVAVERHRAPDAHLRDARGDGRLGVPPALPRPGAGGRGRRPPRSGSGCGRWSPPAGSRSGGTCLPDAGRRRRGRPIAKTILTGLVVLQFTGAHA